MKVSCAASLYLQFGFVIFWQNNISVKAAYNKLVKLITGEGEEGVRRGSPLHLLYLRL